MRRKFEMSQMAFFHSIFEQEVRSRHELLTARNKLNLEATTYIATKKTKEQQNWFKILFLIIIKTNKKLAFPTLQCGMNSIAS